MIVTRSLIALNVLAFIYEIAVTGAGILTGNVSNIALFNAGALVPAAVTQYHQYWRIVTSAFLHGSIWHIGINMFSLWVLGRFMEAVLRGPRTALVYFAAMVGSGFGVVYFSPENSLTLGASGAIYGLFGALFAIGLKLGKPGMDLVKANLGLLVLNLVFTFAVPGIAKAAHVAGLLVGFALTLLIFRPPKPVHARVVDARSGAELESHVEAP